jgi:hypothetical protein
MMPIYNEKALILSDALVVADLHLGLEYELFSKGVKIPSQARTMEIKLSNLIKKSGVGRIIVLGDVKHNIPKTSWMEYSEIPQMFRSLSELADITVIKGNHDGDLEKLLPDMRIVKNLELEEALLTHGHLKIRSPIDFKYIIMGHNHPCVEFTDEFGRSIRESAWIRARLNRRADEFYEVKRNPEIVVMPAFNDLIYGTPFNKEEKLLGPLFRQGVVDLKNAKAYLLDGTMLKLRDIS